MFCGEECRLTKDKKNPSRWKPAYQFRKVEEGKKLKDTILDICNERKDEWSEQIRVRMSAVISDLHAADARYHVTCWSNFLFPRSRASATKNESKVEQTDQAFQAVITDISKDMNAIRNSVDVYALYLEKGGNILSQRSIVPKLLDHFGDSMLVLSSPGVASVIAFRGKASNILRLVPDDDEDETKIALDTVKQRICTEMKTLKPDSDQYYTTIDYDIAGECVSDTVMDLLGRLSPKLDRDTLPGLMIGNIITSVMKNSATHLQVCLANLLKDSKDLINTFHDFAMTCTHDEIRRFRQSAARAAATTPLHQAIYNSKEGLVQAVGDNFDRDIHSQNGKRSTHSMAMVITQNQSGTKPEVTTTIPRIKKADMKTPIEYELEVKRYNGPKKPNMPAQAALKSVLPLKVLASMALSEKRAKECDFLFMCDITTQDKCPEFNGYNTRDCREAGQGLKPKTQAVYLPLIDMPPSDPDTILTTIYRAQQMTEATGQKYTLVTFDMQLYKVGVDIMWANPQAFPNVILRLGGMHTLKSFAGCVGTLMNEAGLQEVLESSFAGVPKMLSGKKYPQNIRAMRMVAEELLRDVLERHQEITNFDGLMVVLEDLATKSSTSKLWLDMLVKPVFIMMMFVRAEREGDFPLHVKAVKLMVVYFFAAGHIHYARYCLFYVRVIEALPPEVLQEFMKGDHVMRHLAGHWNGIWSDMYIETTFMLYGKARGGIVGITLKPEAMKTWALSLHTCGKLAADIDIMRESDKPTTQKTHKEESVIRIEADKVDRNGLKEKISQSIHPFMPDQHPEPIVNIVTGKLAGPSVNVHNAISIATQQMKDFENSWPEGFHNPIQKKVITMAATKKSIQVGGTQVYDTNLIYSRVIGLQASSREVDISEVMSHELSPVPTALFEDSGDMRSAKSKSALKKITQVEVVPTRSTLQNITCTIIDGCALLWIPNWPTGTVQDYVDKFKYHIGLKLVSTDVYLVFDRYNDMSTKDCTRKLRGTGRVHQLSPNTTLPAQKIVLNVTENKKQLITIICSDLENDQVFHQKHTARHKLVVTGQENTPVEISYGGTVIQRNDISTSHEEADNIIVQQAIMCSNLGQGVNVIADDADVYALLVHHYFVENLTKAMIMESPVQDRISADIKGTVKQLESTVVLSDLLAAHAV